MTKEFIDLPVSTTDSILSISLIADLPTQGVVAGSVLYVEQDGLIYVYDGAAWAPISGTVSSLPASSVTNVPAGTISATNVQAALNELDTEKVPTTRNVSAGTGLSGGGDLSADRTISMPAVGTPGTYKSVTTDTQGRVTAGTNPTTLAGYGIIDAQPLDSDLTALAGLGTTGILARTAAGVAATRNIAAGSTKISITDGDGVSGNPTIDAVPGNIDHNGLLNYEANRHVDHTAVSISAGTGLTGGGDISANRTISMPAVGTAGTYGSASSVAVVTTDTQGRVSTAATTAISILASAVSNFATEVRAVVLTGLSTATNTAVTAADTILVAIGKLQAQINSRPAAWIQYSNSGTQTTTQNNTALIAVTLDTDRNSVLGTAFTKFSATEFQTNYVGYVVASYNVNIQNTSNNTRGVRVGIILNGTPLVYAYNTGVSQTATGRTAGTSGTFIIPCAVGDKFQLGFSNAEAITDTVQIAANAGIFTIDARYIT